MKVKIFSLGYCLLFCFTFLHAEVKETKAITLAKVLETSLKKPWDAIRMDRRVSTPPETLLVKVLSLKKYIKKHHDIDLPVFVAPEVADRVVKGWTVPPNTVHSGLAGTNIPLKDVIKYLCDLTGNEFVCGSYVSSDNKKKEMLLIKKKEWRKVSIRE